MFPTSLPYGITSPRSFVILLLIFMTVTLNLPPLISGVGIIADLGFI